MASENAIANTGSSRVTVTDSDISDVTDKKTESKEDFVKRTAYEEVSKDMHKFKSRTKEAEARVAELEAKFKAQEEQQMREQQRYQELYEREKKQREQEAAARKKDRDLYLKGLKMSALKAELGNVRDEYLMHASIDDIEVLENGSLSSESVQAVANKFRQDHPTLIPSSGSGKITGYASPTSSSSVGNGPKSLSQMSFNEKAEMLRNLKK